MLDFEKMVMKQPIKLECKTYQRLSEIEEFKLQASAKSIKAFLAFSENFDQLFVCPLNESDSIPRKPFQILHNNPDKAHNL